MLWRQNQRAIEKPGAAGSMGLPQNQLRNPKSFLSRTKRQEGCGRGLGAAFFGRAGPWASCAIL